MNESTPITLPDGQESHLRVVYTPPEIRGIIVLVVVSCISLITVVTLLAAISLSAFNTRASSDRNLFLRSNVAAYLLSVLVCDLFQAIGSILNATWINRMGVEAGGMCTTQGMLKQISDVGTAVWTFIIAAHTFCQLVLELRMKAFVLWTTLVAGWCGIIAIVLVGPSTLDTKRRGDFFGISGYWCWISPQYSVQRLTLDYLFMFMSAFLCFVLYTLVFLRLRGNLITRGWRWQLRFTKLGGDKASNWKGNKKDEQALSIARRMLWYPVAYTILILPIACVRFSEWGGAEVPFSVTIFSASVFLLSGVVNVVLFSTTRNILPAKSVSMSIPKWTISQPRVIAPLGPEVYGAVDPYYYHDPETVHRQATGTSEVEKPPKRYSQGTSSSESASIPYEHEVRPLEIRRTHHDAPPMQTEPPPISLQVSREGVGQLEGVYDTYNDTEDNDLVEEYSGEDDGEDMYNDVSLNSAGEDPWKSTDSKG